MTEKENLQAAKDALIENVIKALNWLRPWYFIGPHWRVNFRIINNQKVATGALSIIAPTKEMADKKTVQWLQRHATIPGKAYYKTRRASKLERFRWKSWRRNGT